MNNLTPGVCTNRLEIWGDPAQLKQLRRIVLSPDGDACLADLSEFHAGITDYEHLLIEFRKRDAVFGYGTVGRPFPALFFQDVSRQYPRLTFSNVYREDTYCFAGVSVWRNGIRLFDRHVDDYRTELPDLDVYDQDYYNDCLIDLMVTLQLEAAVFQ